MGDGGEWRCYLFVVLLPVVVAGRVRKYYRDRIMNRPIEGHLTATRIKGAHAHAFFFSE